MAAMRAQVNALSREGGQTDGMADNPQSIEWYLARDGQQHGPVSDAELHKIIELGYLKPTDLVWRQGWAEWAPASTVMPPSGRAEPERQASAGRSPGGSVEEQAQAQAESRAAADMTSRQDPGASNGAEATNPDAPSHRAQSRSTDGRWPEPTLAANGYGGGGGYGNPAPGAAYERANVSQSDQPRAKDDRLNGLPAAGQPLSNLSGQAGYRGGSLPAPVAPGTGIRPGAATHQRGPQPEPMTRPGGAQLDGHGGRLDGAAGHAHPYGKPTPGPHAPLAGPGSVAPPAGRRPSPDAVDDKRDGFPWRTAIVLFLLAGLAGGGFALYTSGKLPSLPFLAAPARDGNIPVVPAPTAPARQAQTGETQTPAGAAPRAGPDGLPVSPLWTMLRRDYPDWYKDRAAEVAQLTAQSKNTAEINVAVTRAIVDLRRKYNVQALQSSPRTLMAIAASFVDNLNRLAKHSTAACYGFISQGEASPAVTAISSPEHLAGIDVQLANIFAAVVEGKATPIKHDQPKREDYDALTAQLGKRGWTAADLQLFSDARALARAAPEKVCQMVNDWFAAQLDVPDEAVRTRLLSEALKPVVAG